MGKDAEGACCESCRQFGGENAVLPAPPPEIPIRAGYERVRIVVTTKGRSRAGEAREVIPTGPEVLVGRVDSNHVVLRDGTISKRQCKFVFEDERVIVQDMQSACGTYVDGRKVRVAEVHEGSVISMGDFELRIIRADGG